MDGTGEGQCTEGRTGARREGSSAGHGVTGEGWEIIRDAGGGIERAEAGAGSQRQAVRDQRRELGVSVNVVDEPKSGALREAGASS
jgi:hypothetical protein